MMDDYKVEEHSYFLNMPKRISRFYTKDKALQYMNEHGGLGRVEVWQERPNQKDLFIASVPSNH